MRKIGFVFVILGLLLAGCAVSDLSDGGTVNVSIGGDGRYITGGASSVDEAYLGLIEEDVLYNFEELTNVDAEGGVVQHTFAGIPVGDYTFMAILMNEDDDTVAMALDGVTIKEGLNNLEIEMGPGFTLEIGGVDLELDDLDEVFSVKFDGNIITLELEVRDIFDMIFPVLTDLTIDVMNTNAADVEVLDWDENDIFGFDYTPPSSEGEFSENNPFTLMSPSLTTKFMIRTHSWGTTGLFPDEKGYKDYKIKLVLNY